MRLGSGDSSSISSIPWMETHPWSKLSINGTESAGNFKTLTFCRTADSIRLRGTIQIMVQNKLFCNGIKRY